MKFTYNDFEVQWFSGTGPGGQHRNKTQNCCRVIHKPTGIRAHGTRSRSRDDILRKAMMVCMERVEKFFEPDTARYRATEERVRTYHEPDNRVVDHASGVTDTFQNVVINGNIEKMVEARAKAQMKK